MARTSTTRTAERGAAVALLLALVVLGGAAFAAGAGDAAKAFASGQALFAHKDYARAAVAFERAYALRPHYAVQCSIALCYEQMSRFVEAAEHYRRCLDEGAAATRRAKQVRRSLAGVEARVGWVAVESPGAGGTVHVDGAARGPAPLRVALDPGRHVLEVRRAGAQPATLTLRVLGGDERSVKLVPTELAPARAARSTPVAAPPAAATRPEPTPPLEEPAPAPRSSRRRLSPVWFWTSVALTVALAGTAGVMGGLTYKAHSDYYDSPTEAGYDTFIERRLVTNILAGVAVAAAGTGTVLFFYTDFSGCGRAENAAALGIGLGGEL